ncbi:hypothetical protein D3C86_1396840 [compost metagenome]
MYFANLSNDFSSITALKKFVKSSVPPIVNDFTSVVIDSFNAGHNDLGIYAREAAEHF